LSRKNKIQLNFRHEKVSQQFIPANGGLTDIGVSSDYWVRPNFGISAWVRRERWLFPVIQPTTAHNVTAVVEYLFELRRLFPVRTTQISRNFSRIDARMSCDFR
jgi:hypothetical protein